MVRKDEKIFPRLKKSFFSGLVRMIRTATEKRAERGDGGHMQFLVRE